jgi:hypothetical protein
MSENWGAINSVQCPSDDNGSTPKWFPDENNKSMLALTEKIHMLDSEEKRSDCKIDGF